MRRRRRNRSTWLPIVPTTYGESTQGVTWYEGTVTIPGGAEPGDTSVIFQPLTFDDSSQQEAQTSTASLRDRVEGQDYTLDRVVGKVWMDTTLASDDQTVVEFIGCIALAVLPSDDAGNPAIPTEEYNPLFSNNAMQPWIWRRTWRLTSPYLATPAFGPTPGYPYATWQYGSVADGGHLDTKGSRRRITKEHRLYLIAAAGATNVGAGIEASFVQYGYDIRLIGGMRRARNSSSF